MDEPDGVVVVSTGMDAEIVGMASAGPTRDVDAPTRWELYAINVLASHYGTGLASQLLDAVLGQRPTTLWVHRENARARAFYVHQGFSLEGGTKLHEMTGAPEIRMITGDRTESLLSPKTRPSG